MESQAETTGYASFLSTSWPAGSPEEELASYIRHELKDTDPESQVASYFAGRSVFVTGATGFIGKALVEKLVRSCPDIKRVYLLIRPKRGLDVQARLEKLLKASVFERLRSLPNGASRLEEKVRAVSGDITAEAFGLAETEMAELASEVQVVFNSAASVRFAEPIDAAVRNNVCSVSNLVDFCDKLPKLEALVHVSTAYSNCHKLDTIHEIIYEPPMRGERLVEAVEWLKRAEAAVHRYPEAELAGEAPSDEPPRDACKKQSFYEYSGKTQLLSDSGELLVRFRNLMLERCNLPNTYTLTKNVAESHLAELLARRPDKYLGEKTPVGLVRPSIVGAAWREPNVGFVDNLNGPTGTFLKFLTGEQYAMVGADEAVGDMIPVDMVVNMLICVAFYLARGRAQPAQPGQPAPKADKGIYVFNCVSGNQNPMRWRQSAQVARQLALEFPCKLTVRLPQPFFLRQGPMYELVTGFYQKIPALFADFVAGQLRGQQLSERTSAMAEYRRTRQLGETLAPFLSNEWKFCDRNVQRLRNALAGPDRDLFEFDVRRIQWHNYLYRFYLGIKINLLKESASDMAAAISTLRRRRLEHYLALLSLVLALFYLLLG